MDNRFKKLKWNSLLALCYQVTLVVTGLVLPRCILHYYGSEVNGLVSSITQFLAFINICDLGISAVVSAAYYKPLADGDTYLTSKIFVYSNRFFKIVGFILLAYVMVLLGVYPTVINDSFDFWFTFALIAAMSVSQMGQYFIGISYQLLLTSDQRSYVQLIINGATLIINTVVSVLLMVSGASIQMVKLVTSAIYLARPLIMYLYVKKHYKLDKTAPVDSTVVPQKKNGVVQHVAYMIYENTPVMVLTVFTDLYSVSVYSVYALATNSIKQIINAATTGVQSLLGNMIAREEKKELKSFYSLYNWGVHTLCTVLFTITGLMIVPFVLLYTADITDTNYNLPVFAVLITVACFISCLRNCQYVLIRAAGHFKQTQTASLVEAFLNLGLSVVLVLYFGLVGVCIGTIAATTFFVIYQTIYFHKNIVFISIGQFVKQYLVDALVIGVTVLLTWNISLYGGSVLSWVLQAAAVSAICIAVSLVMQLIFNRDHLSQILQTVLKKVRRDKKEEDTTIRPTYQQDVLNLVQAAIEQKPMDLSESFSIEETLPLLRLHNISTMCFYGAALCGVDRKSPPMQELLSGCYRSVLNSARQDQVFAQISKVFADNQIDYMPLKGILLKHMYPQPEMRVMGDLDILIRMEQYETVTGLFTQLGYVFLKETDHELIWDCKGVHVELHKRVMPSYNKDYYAYFGDGWRLAKCQNGTCYTMTDEDQFVYLFTHYAKHYRDGGIGIKQTVDLHLYLKQHPHMDKAYVRRELSKLQLQDFYDNLCRTLQTWFDGKEEDNITQLITDTVFKSGVFGERENQILSGGVRVVSTTKESARKNKWRKAIFLPYDSMCNRYPVLKRLPIALPIMWIVRWFEAVLFKRANIRRTLEEISVLEEEKVNEQQAKLESIGLSFNFED